MKTKFLSITAAFAVIIFAQAQTPDTQNTTEALAHNKGCYKCHGDDVKGRGPTFGEIAAKYKNDPGAKDALFNVTKYGGRGNWALASHGTPMPPYSASLSDMQIRELIDWVLSL